MKKLIIFIIILSISFLSSCTSIQEKVIYILPEKPSREEIKEPENQKDLINIIIYYDYLVQKWEAWAYAVEIIIVEKNGQ